MKKLSHFVVAVSNDAQLAIAIKFFTRASRRKVNPSSSQHVYADNPMYVGMYADRSVLAWVVKYPHETVVPFEKMDTLADTPSRVVALVKSGWKPAKASSIPLEKRPLVKFNYPTKPGNRNYPLKTVRNVRLIKADANYYIGLEILPDNKFLFKKFLKAKATNVEVLTF